MIQFWRTRIFFKWVVQPPTRIWIYSTPPKINIEPENDGLEDDFSFSRGVFLGSMLIFRGVFRIFTVFLKWCFDIWYLEPSLWQKINLKMHFHHHRFLMFEDEADLRDDNFGKSPVFGWGLFQNLWHESPQREKDESSFNTSIWEAWFASLPISFVDWVKTRMQGFLLAKERGWIGFFIAGGLFVLTRLEKVSKAPPPPCAFFDFFQRTFEVTLVAEMCLNKQHRFLFFLTHSHTWKSEQQESRRWVDLCMRLCD